MTTDLKLTSIRLPSECVAMPRSKSAAEKVRRDRAIVGDRARGLMWARIAERHRVSERYARKIWTAGPVEEFDLLEVDPTQALKDALVQLDAVIEDVALLAEATANDSVRLGAIRARHVAMTDKLELLRACGVLPQFDVWRHEFDMHGFVAMVLEVFDRHGVPREVEDDILATLAAVTGRANGSKP